MTTYTYDSLQNKIKYTGNKHENLKKVLKYTGSRDTYNYDDWIPIGILDEDDETYKCPYNTQCEQLHNSLTKNIILEKDK